VPKYDVARFVDMLVEQQARFGVAQELSEHCLAALDGLAAQVLTVKLDQVEGVKEDAPVIAPVAQPVEHWQSIAVTGDGLAVDQARRGLERERGTRDQWKAAGPVVPVAGEKPHARPVAAHQHSEAVVLDLVQPPAPSGRLLSWARQARLAEVGEAYATQQHGV
jgi:hypothetical protein